MPELPEVESIVRSLRRELIGQRIGRVKVLRRDVIHGDGRPLGRVLPGRHIEHLRRRGKRIVIELTRHVQCLIHLGMSGRLTLEPAEEVLARHTHLRIYLPSLNQELRFCDPRRFGGFWLLSSRSSHQGRCLGPLGPEPLELTFRAFDQLLQRRRAIKSLLLDQRLLAGLGNIYVDESLHAAGIHPLTPATALERESRRCLLRSIKSTLRAAIRCRGTTMRDYRLPDGSPGAFHRLHKVYQRAGLPCRTCGTVIQRLQVAGRSTFVCGVCQTQSQ